MHYFCLISMPFWFDYVDLFLPSYTLLPPAFSLASLASTPASRSRNFTNHLLINPPLLYSPPEHMSLCRTRLQEERKQWRKDHPFGFFAKPTKAADGLLDLTQWKAGIPGKSGTLWADAVYPVTITFPEEYPSKPPKVRFPADFYHPNIYPSGTVCLLILNEEQDWRPAITLKQIVLGIQELLDSPNPESPAQEPAWRAFQKERAVYEKKVREQAKKYILSS